MPRSAGKEYVNAVGAVTFMDWSLATLKSGSQPENFQQGKRHVLKPANTSCGPLGRVGVFAAGQERKTNEKRVITKNGS